MRTLNLKPVVWGFSLFALSLLYANNNTPKKEVYNPQKKCPPPIEAKWGEGNIPCNGYGIYVTADLLVWQANQNNLEFTLQNPAGIDPELFEGPESSPKFGYDVGFRLGMGYTMKHHDMWDAYVEYTHFDARASKSLTSSSSVFQPLLSVGFGGDLTAANASSNWSLGLNMLDAELGKQFFISKFFTCRGFLGLRTAWIKQDDSVRYSGGLLASNHRSPDLISIKNHFWGMGFLAGLETLWGLGAGMSLYADAGTSLLCGDFNLRERETAAGALTNDVIDSFQSMKPITDLAMGVRWDKTFSKDRYHIGLQTGWEFHFFPQQWQWQSQSSAPFTNTDLMIQGWVLSARFDF